MESKWKLDVNARIFVIKHEHRRCSEATTTWYCCYPLCRPLPPGRCSQNTDEGKGPNKLSSPSLDPFLSCKIKTEEIKKSRKSHQKYWWGKGFYQVELTLLLTPFLSCKIPMRDIQNVQIGGSKPIQIQKLQGRERVTPVWTKPPLTLSSNIYSFSFSLLLIYAYLAQCEDCGSCSSCMISFSSKSNFYDFSPPLTLFLILPPIFLSSFFGPA